MKRTKATVIHFKTALLLVVFKFKIEEFEIVVVEQ